MTLNLTGKATVLALAALTGLAACSDLGIGADARTSLPTQYPLMPGDAALWGTLTPVQQQRALLFLADGSTIRSSLKAD